MKRLPTKKLKLSTKSIRVLNEQELTSVLGGVQAGEGDPEGTNTNQTVPTGSANAGSGGCGG